MNILRSLSTTHLLAALCVTQMPHLMVPPPVPACDLCALYTAVAERDDRRGFGIDVGEQYTEFGTRQEGSEEVSNPGEYLRSSITQVLLGYNVNRHVGIQLGLPIIARSFRRLEDGVRERGDETGIGDMPLLVNVRPFTRVTATGVVRLSLFGGLELPTGNPDRLGEEADETHRETQRRGRGTPGTARASGAARAPHASHNVHRVQNLHNRQDLQNLIVERASHSAGAAGDAVGASSIHGHDLALGSGSVDGIIGVGVFTGGQRLFLSAHAQYALRTEGDFDYRYADDLVWSAGPGAFLLLDDRYSVGLQAVVTGETKSKDEHRGEPVDDTGLTTLYMGPRLLVTWGASLHGDVAGELPLVQHNTGLQILPDYRIRGGLSWRF
jgi:hypothetical protein